MGKCLISSAGSGKSAQSEVVAMPAAGPFVTAATMSEMSAAHKAFWDPLSQQSETARAVNCEIQAKDEMIFMMLMAHALGSGQAEAAERICNRWHGQCRRLHWSPYCLPRSGDHFTCRSNHIFITSTTKRGSVRKTDVAYTTSIMLHFNFNPIQIQTCLAREERNQSSIITVVIIIQKHA